MQSCKLSLKRSIPADSKCKCLYSYHAIGIKIITASFSLHLVSSNKAALEIFLIVVLETNSEISKMKHQD